MVFGACSDAHHHPGRRLQWCQKFQLMKHIFDRIRCTHPSMSEGPIAYSFLFKVGWCGSCCVSHFPDCSSASRAWVERSFHGLVVGEMTITSKDVILFFLETKSSTSDNNSFGTLILEFGYIKQVLILCVKERTYVLQRSGSDIRGTDFELPAYTSLLYMLVTSLIAHSRP